MIRINLLPPEFRHAPAKRFKLPPFVSPKGLLCFLAALVCLEAAMAANLKFFAGHRFDQQQNEYRSLGPSLKKVRDIKKQASEMQDVTRQLTVWMEPVATWTAFMNGLAAGMEKGVWLTHLQFERRWFDLPEKPADPEPAVTKPAPGKKAAAGSKPAAQPAPAAASRLGAARGGRSRQDAKEERVVMIIKGRVAVDQQEAAVAGRFIDHLKNQKALGDLVEDLRLDEMRRSPESEVPMFDFVIVGTVKRVREKDFFNLS